MFERYTQKAQRVIFFARLEAGVYGSNQIAAEHLLLGLLREAELWKKLGDIGSVDAFRAKIGPEAPVEKRIPTNKEIPLSAVAKQALEFAVDEADLEKQREIGARHLLAGLLRIGDCRALQVLKDAGVDRQEAIEAVRATDSKG